MRLQPGQALAVGGAVLAALAFAAPEEGATVTRETATFSYQPCDDWSYVLPREMWFSADEHCGIAHRGDTVGFLTEQTGVMALEVDTNGDGKLDQKIKGDRGFAKLRGKDANGDAFMYAVRFKFDAGYKWSPSGVMAGKLAGQLVRIVDQNGNGEYDDFGVDAMLIGGSNGASFLSRVVNLDGQLYDLEVSADGTSSSIAPYTGEVGTLDLRSKFDSQGELVAAVIQSKELSFNAAQYSGAMKVPAAKYDLVSGFVAKGLETAVIQRGKSAPIQIDAGTNYSLAWGGPVIAEFDYSVAGDTITVPPSVSFYGTGGEEYGPFKPDAKSPKILVTDKLTGKLVASGRFGGC